MTGTGVARHITRDPVGSKKFIKLFMLSTDNSWPAFVRINCFPSYAHAGFRDEITNVKQYGDNNLASTYKTKSIYVPKRTKGLSRSTLSVSIFKEEFLP